MPRLTRVPFYYGWVMVGTALAINAVSSALNPVVFSFMIGPMSEDLGVSRSALSWSFTLRLFAGGLSGPVLGVLLDRHGARWIGVGSGLLVGSMLCALAYVDDLWLVYAIFALSGVAGIGGPAGQLLTQVPLAKWFVVRRGRALALGTMGMATGTVLAIPLTEWLLSTHGWRTTTLVLGLIVACVVVPTSAVFVRRSPEDLGLHPDGLPHPPLAETTGQSTPHAATGRNWTAREAMRTATMWQLLGALLIAGTAVTGTLVYRVDFFKSLGVPSGVVALGTALDPATVIFSAFFFGLVAERVPIRYVGSIGLLGIAASIVPMILAQGGAFAVIAHNVLWGTAAGAWLTLNNMIWPNYFGRAHLGAIRGIVLPVSIAASGLGPPLFGLLLDWGMEPARLWTVAAAAFAIAGLAVLVTRPPRPSAPPAEVEPRAAAEPTR